MNESTSSHSCFLRNVPHLHHLQRSHNRDQRSKRHSKVSLRRQLQQPDPTDLQEKLCTAGSLTGPRNDDRIFCLYCRSISDHKKYNVCIYLYRYQKQHIKDTKETSQNKESHKEQKEQLRECKNYRMKNIDRKRNKNRKMIENKHRKNRKTESQKKVTKEKGAERKRKTEQPKRRHKKASQKGSWKKKLQKEKGTETRGGPRHVAGGAALVGAATPRLPWMFHSTIMLDPHSFLKGVCYQGVVVVVGS